MLSSTCITAQAQVYTTAEAQARAEITARKAETYASIYAQLEEQDALNHLSIYLDLLYPEIEAEVYAKYGMSVAQPQATSTITLTWPKGGVLCCTDPDVKCKVAVAYLLPADVKAFLAIDTTALGLLSALVGSTLPASCQPYLAVLSLSIAATDYAQRDILAADGYAKTISVYSTRDGQSSSAVSGWDAHPTVSCSSRLLNVVPNEAK